MTSWHRANRCVIGVFAPGQIAWLREQFVAALGLVDARVEVLKGTVSDSGLTGPVVSVLVTRCGEERASVSERQILASSRWALDSALDTLPLGDDPVCLRRPSHVWSWIWALTDCRAIMIAVNAKAPDPQVEPVIGWLRQIADDLAAVDGMSFSCTRRGSVREFLLG